MYPLNTPRWSSSLHTMAPTHLPPLYAIQHSPGQLAMKYLYVKME